MELIITINAQEDLDYWAQENRKIFDRITRLIADIKKNPFRGLGKPEPLKFHLSDYWSRRIDRQHRLVYKVTAEIIYIIQCRYHY